MTFEHLPPSSDSHRYHQMAFNATNETYNASLPGANETEVYGGHGDFHFDISERVNYYLTQPHRIVALLLGSVAILLNILSILAILKTRNTLTSHYRFIVSLAVSDILIGITVLVHIINFVVNPTFSLGLGPWHYRIQSRCVFMFVKAMNTTSLSITLLNLMAMAIDHFLAIVRPLHYPTLMNRSRATALIVAFWILAILCGFSDFLSGYPKYPRYRKQYNYCEFIFLTKYQDEYPLFAIALICLVVMSCTYVRMFFVIRKRPQMVGSSRQDIPNKKALYTTLFILGTFILCWLPTCLFQVVMIIQVTLNAEALLNIIQVLLQADQYLYDLLLLNAILDPIIYAVRMREVQFGYRKLFSICYNRCKKEPYQNDVTHTSTLGHSTDVGRSLPLLTINPMD